MFFHIELLNKFNHGRFAESWLAATCPTLFRRNYRKNHVLKISVPKICQDIQEMWNTDSNQVKERLSLFLAAQLLYGTVCIHQQQVEFFYETTLDLFCLEREVTRLIRQNRQQDNVMIAKNPRQKLAVKHAKPKDQQTENNFLMEDYGLIVCQSQQNQEAQHALEKSVEEMLQGPDNTTVPNASITLVEEPIILLDRNVREDELNTEEQQIFDWGDYCEFLGITENVQPAKRTKLQEISSSILEVPLEQPKSIPGYSNVNLFGSSLDLINRVNQPGTPMATSNSFDNFYQQINMESTPLREQNQMYPLLDHHDNQINQQNTIVAAENTAEPMIGLIQQESIEPIQSIALVEAVQVPIVNEHVEIARPIIKRGRAGKRRIIIDSLIEITDKCFYSHIQDYTSTLRVLHPSNDVLSLREIELMRDLLHTATHTNLAIPLSNEYKRHLVTKPIPVDIDFFGDLLNPFEIIPPRQDYIKRRGKKRSHHGEAVKIVEPAMIPTVIPLPLETELNVNSMIPIEIPVPTEHEIDIIQAHPQVMETTEMPSLFPNISKLTDSMARERFGKNEIYRSLEILWAHNVHPIGMHTLCAELKQRKYVAMVFYSLLCLQKDGKVKLISNLNDREIYDIQPIILN